MAGIILLTVLQFAMELRDGLTQVEAAAVRWSPLNNRAKGKLLVRIVRVGMDKDVVRSIFGREVTPVISGFGYNNADYWYEEYGVWLYFADNRTLTSMRYEGPGLDKSGRPLPP